MLVWTFGQPVASPGERRIAAHRGLIGFTQSAINSEDIQFMHRALPDGPPQSGWAGTTFFAPSGILKPIRGTISARHRPCLATYPVVRPRKTKCNARRLSRAALVLPSGAILARRRAGLAGFCVIRSRGTRVARGLAPCSLEPACGASFARGMRGPPGFGMVGPSFAKRHAHGLAG